MELQYIPVKEIICSDHLFSLHHNSPQSVQWNGRDALFNPIWLQQTAPHQYRLIDGFHIVCHTVNADSQVLPAFVFPERVNLVTLLGKRVKKRQLENNLSIFALGEIMSKVQDYLGCNMEELQPILSRIDLVSPDKATKVLSFLLPQKEKLNKFCDLYRLGFNELEFLAKKNVEELELLGDLLSGLELTGNKLVKLLSLIDEIKLGSKLSLSRICADKNRPVFKEKTPLHHRYSAISSFLLSLRSPNITRYAKEWDTLVAQIKMPGVTLVKDPTFENDSLKLVLHPSKIEDLNADIRTLQALSQNNKFLALFDFI